MAKSCSCSGSTCGCRVTQGTGIEVTGTGTAANPFVISRDETGDSIDNQLEVDDSTSIEFSKAGDGTAAEPTIISGSVVLRSPNGARWGLSVSNAGVLSAVSI